MRRLLLGAALSLMLAATGVGCSALRASAEPELPLWVHRASGSLHVSFKRNVVAESRRTGEPYERGQVEIDAAYAGYLDRQAADVADFRKEESLTLPADLDYARVGGLSNECREKLAATRPLTLGQAGRIEGVTPGALTALLAHVRRRGDHAGRAA